MSNSLYGLMDIMIAACGLYVVVEYIVMVKSGKLRSNMLIPKDINLSRCKDQEGYIKYIGIKQLFFGSTAFVNGLIGLLQDFELLAVPLLTAVAMALFIAASVWYIYAYKQGIKRYWK